jgi:hypothetical protein
VVAPAGTFRPGAERTTVMVGDGLVCRFDLDPRGITLTSRLARTHDFVADELTSSTAALEHLRFVDSGLVRFGWLGTRNFANTAFLPLGGTSRMLLTYDAGRPVEIDPISLDVLGPIGGRDEWRAEALGDALFPIVLSPAHPCWDREKRELFTVNYGRGLGNIADTVPLVAAIGRLPHWIVLALENLAQTAGRGVAFRRLLHYLERATTRFDRAREAFMDRFFPEIPDTFTDLMRWDGSGRLERFRLVLPDDREVRIVQSVHQLAVTKEHVIVLETAFKIGLASGFNDPAPRSKAVDRMIRAVLTQPQIASTVFYVVKRSDLDRPLPPGDDGVRRVRCRRIEIPIESDHFLADYDDAGGKITLHVAHAPATDLGEWIRPFDQSAYDDQRAIAEDLHGFLAVGAMDVGRFGRYVIDAARGEVVDAKTMVDEERSWAIALYAGHAINTEDAIPEKNPQLYWCTEGFQPELLTDFVYDLYADYPHRLVSTETIRGMGSTGRPSAILRVDTGPLTIEDGFSLAPGTMAGSMQLVPNGRDGYLVGTVYTEARTELWILDAGDLSRGPIARLASPDLTLGFSLHTAWVPELGRPSPGYRIGAREELARHTSDPALRAAFERSLYPRFE